LSGNIAPSREKGKSSSKYAERGVAECSPTIGCELSKQVNNQMIGNAESFFIPEVQPSYGIPGNWIGRKPENGGNATEPMYDIAPCLTKTDQHGVAQNIAYDMKQHHNPQLTNTIQLTTKNCFTVRGDTPLIQGTDLYNGAITGDVAVPMTNRADGTGTGPTVMQQMAVRRLTPKECERLQGFPDNYSDIMPKGKPTPDGPRYKALGNSMAVPVMAWIGKRIQEVDNL
jgi:DNA (cytosine-5)-methyltransferase 1